MNEELELPDGSYYVSDIHDCFEYVVKQHGERNINPSIRIYINKIENRIIFKIATGYHLERLIPETMKLTGSTKSNINKNEKNENVANLEINEAKLLHCTIVINDYPNNSRVLYEFVPN